MVGREMAESVAGEFMGGIGWHGCCVSLCVGGMAPGVGWDGCGCHRPVMQAMAISRYGTVLCNVRVDFGRKGAGGWVVVVVQHM